jgi:methyl-accepting chemotaxis protein
VESLNQMVTGLRQIVHSVMETTNMINSLANEISASVEEQAAIASEQSASVAEITSTMEELSVSSTQVAGHSNQVTDIAVKSLQSTKEGAADVERVMAKMKEINIENKNNIKEIVDLGRKSAEITKVMEIINNVADQTKLIAFNAALEASSAGEAGKRFGVVAAEIRRLADSVMESTSETESKINEIQEAVNHIVIASEKGSKGIQEGLDSSTQTATKLAGIVEGAQATVDAAKHISLSTQQAKIASEQVVKALREIAQGANQNSDSIQQINLISKDMTKLAGNLKKLIDNFKLDDRNPAGIPESESGKK